MLLAGYVALAEALPALTSTTTFAASPDTLKLMLELPAAGGASAMLLLAKLDSARLCVAATHSTVLVPTAKSRRAAAAQKMVGSYAAPYCTAGGCAR